MGRVERGAPPPQMLLALSPVKQLRPQQDETASNQVRTRDDTWEKRLIVTHGGQLAHNRADFISCTHRYWEPQL